MRRPDPTLILTGFEPFARSKSLGRLLQNPGEEFIREVVNGLHDLGTYKVETIIFPVPSINEGATSPQEIMAIFAKRLSAAVTDNAVIISLGQGASTGPRMQLETRFCSTYSKLENVTALGDEMPIYADPAVVTSLSGINDVTVSTNAGYHECNALGRYLAVNFPRRSAFYHVPLCTAHDFDAWSNIRIDLVLDPVTKVMYSIAEPYVMADVIRETYLRLAPNVSVVANTSACENSPEGHLPPGEFYGKIPYKCT